MAFYAATAVFSSWAWKRASASAGGTCPMGPSGRRWLNQCTHSLLRADLRFEGGELDCLEAAPGPSSSDHLGLEEADHRLGQRVVAGVPDRANGGLDPRLGEAPRSYRMARYCDPRSEWAISPAPFAGRRWWIACSRAPATKPAVALRLTRPARDAPGVGVEDEGDMGEALPGRHVGEVADPEPIRCGRVEPPVHVVQRAGCCRVLDGPRPSRAPPRAAPWRASAARSCNGRPRRPPGAAAARPSERRESPKVSA